MSTLAESPTEAVVAAPSLPARLVSLDAYRGFVMLMMASEQVEIDKVLNAASQHPIVAFVADQFTHREWTGATIWDMIQPSFSFMVGVALAYSFASRKAKGETYGVMLRHAAIRSLGLILLGIFLRSTGREQTNFTFEDTLTQIGLGYFFLFLLAGRSVRVQVAAAAGLLIAYWLAFALYPLPAPGFDYSKVGVPADWHHLSGFAAHWDKNTNFAAAADQWWMNLFPRSKPFVYNGGGYLTLSFIPTLATMILGLLAGGLFRSDLDPQEKVRRLVWWGIVGMCAAAILHYAGICPIVKRIWTPSWTLYSGGYVALALALFYWLVDLRGYKKWTFPLVVVGMNSIAMYCLVHLEGGFFQDSLKIHLGHDTFRVLGDAWEPFLLGLGALVIEWLILLWMYRRRIFLRF
jgi:heparan-alpha-glucosaminide N-acetyltransferase